MCSMVLFFSCKDSYTSAIKVEYSGQELFEGIIFGVGPAAKHLPCLTSITKVEDLLEESDPIYKEFIAIKYLLLQTLEDDNINFFSDFKRGIQSGDHLTIQETLNMASVKYREVIIKISGLNDNELNTTANSLVKKYDLLDKEGKYSKENLKNAIRSLNNTENGKKSAA